MKKRSVAVYLLALTGFLFHVEVLGDASACKSAADAKECDNFCRMTWGKASLHNIPWTRGGCFKGKCDCVFNEEQLGRYSLPKCPGTTKTWLPLEHQVNLAEAEYQSQLRKMGAKAQFEVFKQTWGKNYATAEEEEKRFKIFEKNLAEIKRLNDQRGEREDTAVFGVNKFADLTVGYKNSYGILKRSSYCQFLPGVLRARFATALALSFNHSCFISWNKTCPENLRKTLFDEVEHPKGEEEFEEKYVMSASQKAGLKRDEVLKGKSPSRKMSKPLSRQMSKSPSRQMSKSPSRQMSKPPSREMSKPPSRKTSKPRSRKESKTQNLRTRGLNSFKRSNSKDGSQSASPQRSDSKGRSRRRSWSPPRTTLSEDERSYSLGRSNDRTCRMDDDDENGNRRRRRRRQPQQQEEEIPRIIGPDPNGRPAKDWRVPARLYPPVENQVSAKRTCRPIIETDRQSYRQRRQKGFGRILLVEAGGGNGN
ncbi:unnamed protein product [Bemisia tabaci]|uniref:Cathepsin propeptide inhibitor domain-containing protein n=1 Tax=Bemisia tabaci TaxID=7038 RepID=A0A9P0AIB9_BEMTA|nr:unnamed protein product [Bemisia tabaci]